MGGNWVALASEVGQWDAGIDRSAGITRREATSTRPPHWPTSLASATRPLGVNGMAEFV